MSQKKIVTILGARPQFIKAAAVTRQIVKSNDLEEIIVHTGQHYDNNMSQIFFDELDIPKVHYQLGVGSASHAKQTAEMLIALEDVLIHEKPDWVLIYGDTNSTLAGALTAAKLHLPIAHVEAGLRSYNRKMPEEINRLVADQLATKLFAPTQQAVINLQNEGYSSTRIAEVGDVMYDAALYFADKASKLSQILTRLKVQTKEYILATIHRAENTDDAEKLTAIFTALERIADTLPILLPLHPRTKKYLHQVYPQILSSNKIRILEPLGFLDMLMLEKHAALIMTDSGGIQKEAFFYQVPCITLREETEWVESVQLGWNTLVAPRDPQHIQQQAQVALHRKGTENQFPYGRGDAALQVIKHLAG
jgi:UDP-GlcNAc3NAcA epimerase